MRQSFLQTDCVIIKIFIETGFKLIPTFFKKALISNQLHQNNKKTIIKNSLDFYKICIILNIVMEIIFFIRIYFLLKNVIIQIF